MSGFALLILNIYSWCAFSAFAVSFFIHSFKTRLAIVTMHCPTIFSFLLLCGSVISTPVAVRAPSKYPTLPYDTSSKRVKTDGYRAVGYFGNWVCTLSIPIETSNLISSQDIYARNYFITDVPASQLTHLVYSFANVNSTTGEV